MTTTTLKNDFSLHVAELNAKKIEAVGMLLDVKDENTLTKVMSYIIKVKENKPLQPCCFTEEELRRRVIMAEKDIANGEGTSHEDFVKEMMLW